MNTLEQFEAYRPLMFSIAYRMLGSVMEAEDILQEAYLRYQRVSTTEHIESPKAYLCTMVTRLCINALQSARTQRETYIGPWLPEPLHTPEAFSREESVSESLSMAFLILLERLTPLERAVFLLREAFDYEYAEIAEIVDKEEATCRQIYSRAKHHVVEHRPRFKPSPTEHRQMLTQFTQAVGQGDLDGLLQLLAENVTMWADGGGKARGAAILPLFGSAAVGKFLMASVRFAPKEMQFQIEELNGELAIVLRADQKAFLVVFIHSTQGKIDEIRSIGNPDKLQHLMP